MIIRINRELKIKLIKALQSGEINTNHFPEFQNIEPIKYDISFLTDEERAVLLKIGEHELNRLSQ